MATSTGGRAPNTNSTLQGSPNSPSDNRTSTALSTNITILVNGNAVGAIQDLSIDESRSIAMIDEVGTDGHIDSAPNKSTDITGSCNRTVFDGMRIAEAFSRGFIHVAAQRLPFDIEIQDNYSDLPIVTIIKNIWFNKIGVQYRANDFVIVQSASFNAETIYSHLATTNQNATRSPNGGGERGFATVFNDIERAADRGDRRGALDAADLLHAFGS